MATSITSEDSLQGQTSTPFRFDDPTHRLLVGLAFLLIAVIGVIGNSLLLFAVMLSRMLHTTTNIFVVNLAMSDLIGCLTLPFSTVIFVSQHAFSDSFCIVVSGVLYIMFPASVVNLMLIAINRYTLITKTQRTFDKIYTKRNISIMIIFSWLYVILVTFVPPAFGVGALGYSKRYQSCAISSENPLTVYYVALRSALIPVAGLVVTTMCYIKIFLFVCKATSDMKQRNISSSSLEQVRKRQVRVTKNLFLIVCCYVLCITPYRVVYYIPAARNLLPWAYYFGGMLKKTLCSGVTPMGSDGGNPGAPDQRGPAALMYIT
ncbi:putative somatostatin receptor type 2-like [Apostichopus japonicus]|uniref:Putative somatostatin receptor type 2-like n=1 Tax=Stichopus japonicus TaxID=307972 RepID=A0A2G8K0A4_STIJA|nr:putative somatostatin receptor type 2-like [Apostichopus japonicus]